MASQDDGAAGSSENNNNNGSSSGSESILATSIEASNKIINQLKAKIQTWKNLSGIKQDILNHREKEVKNMIRQFKIFEDAISNEKILRRNLTRRAENAEIECIDLTDRLNKNITKLDNLTASYENRIVGLVAELKNANNECEQSNLKIIELENKIKELKQEKETSAAAAAAANANNNSDNADVEEEEEEENDDDNGEKWVVPTKSYLRIFSNSNNAEGTSSTTTTTDSPLNTIRLLRIQLEEATEKNRILSSQMILLNSLFLETEENSIDFERVRAIGEIVKESMGLTKPSASNLTITIDGQESDADPTSNCLINPEQPRKSSFDVTGIIEKLDASNQRKVDEIPGEESCYKSVDTTAGPKLVLSVSRTYIKLKDLILEKKSLQNEIHGLKELNDKLSVKVDQQSRRLYRVAGELNKTWKLVSILKSQHKQLHTSKAVLRYELQEKRKLLEKLKRDLSNSREKWIRVRQKNSESEIEWLKIREEFTKRRQESSQSQESAFFSEADEPTIASSISSISNDDEQENGLQNNNNNTQSESKTSLQEDNKSSPVLKPKLAGNGNTSSNQPVEEIIEVGAVAAAAETFINEDVELSEDFEEPILEGACGIDVVHFDDQLDELDELAEDLKTIEAAADTTDDEEDDDAGIFDGTEVNWERLVSRRAARLQILEEQCRLLYNNLSTQKAKSVSLASKLATLHNHFGSDSDNDILPSEEAATSTAMTDQSRPADEEGDEDYAVLLEGEEEAAGPSSYVLGTCTNEYQNSNSNITSTNENDDNQPEIEVTDDNHFDNIGLLSEINSNSNSSSNNNEAGPIASTSSSTASSKCENYDCINGINSVHVHDDEFEHNSTKNSISFSPTDEESRLHVEVETEKTVEEEEGTIGQSTIEHTNYDDDHHHRQHVDLVEDNNRNGIIRPDDDDSTIIITEETLGQIRNNTNNTNLVVRDVEHPIMVPTSQNHEFVLNESYQNLASIVNSSTINSVVISETPNINTAIATISTFEPTIINNSHILSSTTSYSSSSSSTSASSAVIPLNSLMITVKTDENTTNNNIQSPISSSSINTTTTDIDDENDELDISSNSNSNTNNSPSSSQRSPADLNSLGRLIIQQLPKRLEMLKHENSVLTEELIMNDKILKKTEEELQNQKHLSLLLQNQIEQQNIIEMKLHQELDLQQQLICELKHEIGNGKECFENLLSDKQTLSNFVQIYNEDKLIQDAKNTVKLLTPNRKTCSSCNCKFGIFKKKYCCKNCGYDFCNKCSCEAAKYPEGLGGAFGNVTTRTLPSTSSSSMSSSLEKTKGRICTNCHERKKKIETLLIDAVAIQ